MKRISKAQTRFHEIRNTRYASPRASLHPLYADLQNDLDGLRDRQLLRALAIVEDIRGAEVRIHGRWLVTWCSNDYLGLSLHPRVIRAAADAARRWGVGARASRLLAGTTALHAQLESELAAFFGTESALVFASGYLANLGTLTTLLQPEDTVYLDRLCHASLVDACRASRARLRVFAHQDAEHLSTLLKRPRPAPSHTRGRGRCLVVTEGVFSMDGDRAPLNPLLDVARDHDAILYVDDAHGAFVLGPTGRGSPEAAGLTHQDFLYMGTLGKALGAQGGFVVGPRTLIDALVNRARPFIYATALAVPVAAAALEALAVIQEEPALRTRLSQRVERLHERLNTLPFRGHNVGNSSRTQYGVPGKKSHIVPILVGSAQAACALSAALREQGIWAPAIRPPTVPANTARLRLSVTALHTDAHVDQLVQTLQQELRHA